MEEIVSLIVAIVTAISNLAIWIIKHKEHKNSYEPIDLTIKPNEFKNKLNGSSL